MKFLLLGLLLIPLSVLCLRRRYLVVTVRGRSMAPGLADGDRLLVRRGAVPRIGQVVVASTSRKEFPRTGFDGLDESTGDGNPDFLIKRVAPPGSWNGETATHIRGEVRSGEYYLLGDNLPVSLDSRQLGTFSADEVVGVVRRRLNSRTPATAE
ncbi:S26 family signal peptidase [Streptomyces antioxidans]|uniref:S26 family signal peptidase n=1 Tax=Streptomyces antioxidans TaxID=1507734 RepID=A0A1V4D480_9ACTN|nr:S26 family signal peptidase [Streptomyces antioxidans]OPF79078.1 S26 family signal peptidase [Streptomyces antioxidans]